MSYSTHSSPIKIFTADEVSRHRHWSDEDKLRIEKVSESSPGINYPRLLKASGACPPEDVGGVYGYEESLQTLADPEHEQHEEMAAAQNGQAGLSIPKMLALKELSSALQGLQRSGPKDCQT